MAPHRALQTNDIVLHIFQCLSPPQDDEPDRSNQRALARSARVCKSFSNAALNVLWEKMDSMVPSLCLFAAFKQVRGDMGGYNTMHIAHMLVEGEDIRAPSVWTLCGQPTPAEWSRFKQYATRVRAITSPKDDCVDASSLMLLSQENNCEPLFPHLRAAIWHRSPSIEAGLLAVMSLSVRRLRLVYNDLICVPYTHTQWPITKRDYGLQAILDSVGAYLPSLETFEFEGLAHSFSLTPISNMKALRSVDLAQLTCVSDGEGSLLEALSTMADLDSLNITSTLRADLVPKGSGFVNLRSLTIHRSWENVVPLLLAVSLSPLEEFHLLRLKLPPPEAFYSIGHALRQFSSTLRVFDMQLTGTDAAWSDNDHASSTTAVIRPLFRLEFLESFSWDWQCTTHRPFATTDEDLYEIGIAWPNLRILSLLGPDHRDTFPTVRGLQSLLQSCPKLSQLFLPGMDPSLYPDFSDVSYDLQTLVVEQQRHTLGDTHRLAKELSHLLPKLDVVCSSRTFVDKMGDPILNHPWNGVMEMVGSIRRGKQPPGACSSESS